MSMDLEQLLRHAEASAGPPPQRIDDMGAAVRSLARRRRSWRVGVGVGGGAAAALVVILSVFYAARPDRSSPIARGVEPSASPEQVAHLMASLSAEAEARLAIVKRLTASKRAHNVANRIAAPDPLFAVRREQEKAAYLLIYQADRLAGRPHERPRAAEEYRRVLALFPETHWASIARNRLVEMNGSSRGPLVRQANEDMS